MQKVHVGKAIKTHLEEHGMSVSELARRLSRSSQSIYHVFNSESIDTKLLQEISSVLKHNFFTLFVSDEENASLKLKGGNRRRVSVVIDVDEVVEKKLLKQLGITLK